MKYTFETVAGGILSFAMFYGMVYFMAFALENIYGY